MKRYPPRKTCKNGHDNALRILDSKGHMICPLCAKARARRRSYKNYAPARRAQAKYYKSQKYLANRQRYYERLRNDPARRARLLARKAERMRQRLRAMTAPEKKVRREYMRRWRESPGGRMHRQRKDLRLPHGTPTEVVQLFVKFNQLKKELRR